ncbi:MAG: type VI secretion system ImpA family N-terminal domain-containing protein [Siculibacillus sp.]|nr:type VI secretion system ImpA family N-terminal domain-containing protein [Siculibacillus sp.]
MNFDTEAFLAPISEADPCGPDLDLAGDPDYQGFVAHIEGKIPSENFAAFDRTSIDYKAENAVIDELTTRTRDLRLMVFRAKLALLNRDLPGFVAALEIVAAALDRRWDEINPRGEDGDFLMRVVTVGGLDDRPNCLLPLETVPLFETRRFGPVSWRAIQIAEGKLTAREGESAPDAAHVDRAFVETDPAAPAATLDLLGRIRAAIETIDQVSMDKGGFENRITLPNLAALVDVIAGQLRGRLGGGGAPVAAREASEDVGMGGAPVGAATVASPPEISRRRDARRAMASVQAYFASHEPNSPALLLLRFANKAADLPFEELIRLMMPDHRDRASIPMAKSMFRLSVTKATETVGESWREESVESEADGDEAAAEGPDYEVSTRGDALRLISALLSWYQVAEPSSPIPLLLGRARELAERDFATLMRELFSDSALESLKGDEWR